VVGDLGEYVGEWAGNGGRDEGEGVLRWSACAEAGGEEVYG
jgi:hypothetical protein